jgi:hypothetical protein
VSHGAFLLCVAGMLVPLKIYHSQYMRIGRCRILEWHNKAHNLLRHEVQLGGFVENRLAGVYEIEFACYIIVVIAHTHT